MSFTTCFIICTHNNRDIIHHCLDSIMNQTDQDWEGIVIDDASSDGTADLIESRWPRFRVIRQAKGQGPSLNRNTAMEQTESEFAAILDSDVALDEHWLERAKRVLRDRPDVGIAGGKLLYAANPSRINSYGGELGAIGIAWDGFDGSLAADVREPIECLWICSAAMLARRALLREIGGFDGTFFYGYEDSDIGWRAVIAGYRCLCVPDVIAYHRARTTIGKMGSTITFHYHKNRLRSMLRNLGWRRLWWALPLYKVYSVADFCARGPRWPKVRAWFWNIRRLPETMRLRRLTNATRVKSDSEVSRLISRRLLPPTRLADRQKFKVPSEPQASPLN